MARRRTIPAGSWIFVAAVASLLGCSVPVAGGLAEADASQAAVALEKNGIASEKERDPEQEGLFRVLVGRDDAPSALAVLSAEGLPPRTSPGVLDALGKGSLVPSRLAEHAKLVSGTSGELERSLRALDGVLSARVHLAVPPRDPLALGEQTTPATASVLLRHRGPTPPLAAAEVQRLVAGAVPGLAPTQVSVVMTPAPPSAKLGERELSRVGPLTLTRASMTPLRWIVAVVVLLNAVLLGSLFLVWSRWRRAQLALLGAAEAAKREKR